MAEEGSVCTCVCIMSTVFQVSIQSYVTSVGVRTLQLREDSLKLSQRRKVELI